MLIETPNLEVLDIGHNCLNKLEFLIDLSNLEIKTEEEEIIEGTFEEDL